MSNTEHPVITRFHDELQLLQQTARSPQDVSLWLVKSPLLQKVSDILCDVHYRRVTDEAPGFNWLEINSDLVIGWGALDTSFQDKHMKHYQIYSFIRYAASTSLNLHVVGAELAKAGLFIVVDRAMDADNEYSRELQEEMTMGSLFFSPAKWPFVAGALVHEVLASDTLEHKPVTELVRDVYPSTDANTLVTMVQTGLLDNGLDVCNWLLENEKPRPVPSPGVTPPMDF